MRIRIIGLAGLIGIGGAVADTVYRSTDKAGNPVFTDQPERGAKAVELPPTNTVESVEPRPIRGSEPADEVVTRYDSVRLLVPSIVPNGLAGAEVVLETTPPLQEEHRWRLLLDGALVAEPSESRYHFGRLERGQHVALAEVVDGAGRILGESLAVEFFVYWPGGKNR